MKPIIMYLRPFASDGIISVPNPDKSSLMRNLMPTSGIGTENRIGLEELLLRCSDGRGLLIGIGKTSKVIGSGKLLADQGNWKDYFTLLARRTVCIVSIPSMHPSTLWELEWLARMSLFQFTMMIITEQHFCGGDVRTFDIRAIREKLSASGWQIPLDVMPGSLLSFSGNGNISAYVRDSKYKIRIIRDFLSAIMDNNPRSFSDGPENEA